MHRAHTEPVAPGSHPTRRTAVAAFGAAALAAALPGCGAAPVEAERTADGRARIDVLMFRAPSLGAFLPAVMKDRGIDADNGLDITFVPTTPDNYNTEFATGNYQVGASAALLSEALRTERGIDVAYLFNLFDYFTAVVTSDPDIRELADLEGHRLAAATGTTNHAMFEWFAAKAGLDLDGTELLNQTTGGLSTMALVGRAEGTEIWEPAYSSLTSAKPDIRTLDMGIGRWKKAFGTDQIPYLGVAAHRDWAKANPDVVRDLYAAYRDTAEWISDNPADAAALIAATIPNGKPAVIEELIRSDERLRLNVAPAPAMRSGIDAVFAAGRQTGYLSTEPPATIIHGGLS